KVSSRFGLGRFKIAVPAGIPTAGFLAVIVRKMPQGIFKIRHRKKAARPAAAPAGVVAGFTIGIPGQLTGMLPPQFGLVGMQGNPEFLPEKPRKRPPPHLIYRDRWVGEDR